MFENGNAINPESLGVKTPPSKEATAGDVGNDGPEGNGGIDVTTALSKAYRLIEAGEMAAARATLTPLLELDPPNIDALWLQAHATETPEDAQAALEKVLKIDPNYPGAQELLQAARNQAVAVAETAPAVADPLNEAYKLVESDDLAGARAILAPILVAEPDNVDAWWIMVHAAATPDEGKAALEKVRTLNPNYPGLQELLEEAESAPKDAPETAPDLDPHEGRIDKRFKKFLSRTLRRRAEKREFQHIRNLTNGALEITPERIEQATAAQVLTYLERVNAAIKALVEATPDDEPNLNEVNADKSAALEELYRLQEPLDTLQHQLRDRLEAFNTNPPIAEPEPGPVADIPEGLTDEDREHLANINSADTLPALEAIKTQLEARRRGINTKITALFATPGPADKTRRTELNEELDAVEYLFTQLNSRQQMLEANAERLSVVRRQAMIDAETDRVLAEMFPDVPREDLDPNVIRLAEHVAQTEIDRQLTAGGENPPTITVPEANPVRRRPLELAKAILKKIREAIPRKKENIPQAENTEIILRVIYRGLTEPTDIAYFKKLLKRIVTAEPANYTADTKDLLRVIASISEPTALAYVQTPTWTEQSDFLRKRIATVKLDSELQEKVQQRAREINVATT